MEARKEPWKQERNHRSKKEAIEARREPSKQEAAFTNKISMLSYLGTLLLFLIFSSSNWVLVVERNQRLG